MSQVIVVTIALIASASILAAVLMLRWLRQNKDQRQDAPRNPGRLVSAAAALLVLWSALVILVARELDRPTTAPTNELLVEAVVSQCRWSFDYPQSGYSSTELVIPVGRPLRINMTSLESKSTFSVPDLSLESKVLPGRWTTLALTPKEIDDYPLVSDVGCGDAASGIAGVVHVVEPMAFQSWLVMQAPSIRPTLAVSLAEKGRQVAEVSGCLGCHSIDGSEIAGPSLQGLYGQQRKLEDGSTVLASDDYIRASILEPGAQIAAGFPNIMPAAYSMFTGDEIQAITAFVASLE